MKVRDRRYKITQFKGHVIDCPYADCPCLSCYNVQDCGYYLGSDPFEQWLESFDCLTHVNHGCPDPKPQPNHLFRNTKRFQNRKAGDIFCCIRCGQLCTIGKGEFDFEIID